jgi:hypothetical protein
MTQPLEGKDKILDEIPEYHELLIRENELMLSGRVERDSKKADKIADELNEVRHRMVAIETQTRMEGKL